MLLSGPGRLDKGLEGAGHIWFAVHVLLDYLGLAKCRWLWSSLNAGLKLGLKLVGNFVRSVWLYQLSASSGLLSFEGQSEAGVVGVICSL